MKVILYKQLHGECYSMPYGGTSSAQDKRIEKCVAEISGTNERTGKSYTESEKIAICKSQIMGKSYIFADFEFKTEADDYFVEGVISSTNPDLGNDILTENVLNQMAESINSSVSAGKPIPLGYEHTEFLGGHPNLVPVGSFVKAWVDGGKLFAKASLNKALAIFKEVKSALDRRDIHSFSIEYIPELTQESFIEGVKHRIIDSLKAIVGVAVTGRPMNPDAVMNFAAKNLDFSLKSEVIKVDDVQDVEVKEAHMDEKEMEAHKKKKKMEGEMEEKTIEVSKEQFNKLKEIEAKEVEVSEKAKIKAMFDEFYKGVASTTLPVGAPVLDATRINTPVSVPEIDEWAKSIEAGKPDMMYKSAAKLVDYYEAKGINFGTMPRVAKNFVTNATHSGMEPAGSWSSNKLQLKSLVELKAQIEHDTGRTTSGTEYFLSGPMLNDIFGPAIISHLNESHTLYGLFRKENVNGRYGDTYGFRYKKSRASAAAYDESGTDNPTAATVGYTKAHIPFVWYRSVGQVSGPTIEAARGQGGIGDVMAQTVSDHMEGLIYAINVQLFDSSSPADGMTRGGDIMSLRWLTDDSSTHASLYSLTRTSGNETTLQGNITAKSNTPNPNKDDLRTMIRVVLANGARAEDLAFVTSYVQWTKILGLLDDAQRFNGVTNPAAGFVGQVSFDGIPVIPDQNCDAGYVYLLDLRNTFLAVQLPPTVEELAKTGDFRKFQIKTYLALVCTAPNHNYLTTGFATS